MGRDDNLVKISVQRKINFKKAQNPSQEKRAVWTVPQESGGKVPWWGREVRFGAFSARQKIVSLSLWVKVRNRRFEQLCANPLFN